MDFIHSLQLKGGVISEGMYSQVNPILKKTTNQITVPHLFNLKQKVEAQSFGLCSFEYGTKLKILSDITPPLSTYEQLTLCKRGLITT